MNPPFSIPNRKNITKFWYALLGITKNGGGAKDMDLETFLIHVFANLIVILTLSSSASASSSNIIHEQLLFSKFPFPLGEIFLISLKSILDMVSIGNTTQTGKIHFCQVNSNC